MAVWWNEREKDVAFWWKDEKWRYGGIKFKLAREGRVDSGKKEKNLGGFDTRSSVRIKAN